jgi:hypothetical protein
MKRILIHENTILKSFSWRDEIEFDIESDLYGISDELHKKLVKLRNAQNKILREIVGDEYD